MAAKWFRGEVSIMVDADETPERAAALVGRAIRAEIGRADREIYMVTVHDFDEETDDDGDPNNYAGERAENEHVERGSFGRI